MSTLLRTILVTAPWTLVLLPACVMEDSPVPETQEAPLVAPMPAEEALAPADELALGVQQPDDVPHLRQLIHDVWNRDPGSHHRRSYGGVGLELDGTDGNLVIQRVFEQSPAEAVRLVPGDIIRSIDGLATSDMSLHDAVGLIRGEPGTSVELTVERDGTPMIFTIPRTEIARPRGSCHREDSTEFGGVGASVAQVPEGVRIDGVIEGLPAALGGLSEGDVILSIDGEPTAGVSLWEAIERIRGEAGTTVNLEVQRANGITEIFALQREVIVLPNE